MKTEFWKKTQMLVSRFLMVRANTGGVLLEWTNALPIDPEDVLLSRLRCDSVAIVVSGGLKATCRRYVRNLARYVKQRPGNVASEGFVDVGSTATKWLKRSSIFKS